METTAAVTNACDWTIYIVNDNCPDYTWAFTEEQVRQGLADLVAAHLDVMTQTDGERPENQDRYTMAVTQEALCFVERYPERTEELIRRIKEGRICVSPFLCNSLPAYQSMEGVIRSLYPARRLEREWGIPIDIAEHIEEPSLPWGLAALLAGCGIRWLSKPYYAYGDSTWGQLENPPLFYYEGPDGSSIRVILDRYASGEACYTQGALLLRHPNHIMMGWLPHYQSLGAEYPLQVILASGTHLDITPVSYKEPPLFAAAIKSYNQLSQPHPQLINATLRQFCEAVDKVESVTPFLPVVRGCFGHGWDTWPVSLAKYVTNARNAERAFLAAEALLALASAQAPQLLSDTASARRCAEWCLAMLGDHAVNAPAGDYPSAEELRRHNAELRRSWAEKLEAISNRLLQCGWEALALTFDETAITVFNPISVPRRELICVSTSGPVAGIESGDCLLPAQTVVEHDTSWLYFVSPQVPGYGLQSLKLRTGEGAAPGDSGLRATEWELESPFYRICVDHRTGAISSLIHKESGSELVLSHGGRSLGETSYHDGVEHRVSESACEIVSVGPVLARLKTTGMVADICCTNTITVYAELDRVDLAVSIRKPLSTSEQRLCQIFPVTEDVTGLKAETTAAVITPLPQPEGDLLPGANPRKIVVQGFVDAQGAHDVRVLLAPVDNFLLRLDLDLLTFEALGNDQNFAEVSRDQNGVTDFQFRYAISAYQGEYDAARGVAWSRSVAAPLIIKKGLLPANCPIPDLSFDSSRGLATCLKPAGFELEGVILRIWETAGCPGPLALNLGGFRRCLRTDLLERDLEEIEVKNGIALIPLPARGFTAVRLLP